jgi:hypothetical protein
MMSQVGLVYNSPRIDGLSVYFYILEELYTKYDHSIFFSDFNTNMLINTKKPLQFRQKMSMVERDIAYQVWKRRRKTKTKTDIKNKESGFIIWLETLHKKKNSFSWSSKYFATAAKILLYKQIEFDIFLYGKYIYCYGIIFCPLSKYFAQEA